MNFDRVARHYRWLETLVFGNQLQEARIAFLREIPRPRRVLVLGEGNGRFLAEFVRAHPTALVDCVEASARMIELARQRVNAAQLHFIHANVQDTALKPGTHDLIVTHFFLDCFDEKALSTLIDRLACAATPAAYWLVADFCEPKCGWRRLHARFLIAFMYFFFRAAAGIEARRLVDYRPFLQAKGFILAREVLSPNEMVRSELWRCTLQSG
ncbi:MAG: class I SAM-dependent methyltransferase [Chthoniobacterales bacterium]